MRRLRRCRCLQLMALLACLLFVTTAATAVPMSMSMAAPLSAHSAASAAHGSGDFRIQPQQVNAHPHGAADAGAACGGAGDAGCHCAAMSAGLLPMVAAVTWSPMQLPRFAAISHGAAPSPLMAAPMRPPQA